MTKENWATYLKVLVLSSLMASVGNFMSTSKAGNPVTPLEAIPGLCFLLIMVCAGLLIWSAVGKVSKKNLPAIAYISFIAIIMTIPGVPGSAYVTASVGKIGLLPLCTPILAYAGISIGKDLGTFKQQGPAIILVSLFAFVGTYVGSAIIAQIILSVTGVI